VFLIIVVILLAEAVPKKILDLMDDENLTRENVASHLQVFFLSLIFSIRSSEAHHRHR